MVRRALLPPLLLLALLLPGCTFFTASLFPGYLAQAERSYDLGSSIDGFLAGLGGSGYSWHPKVFVLTSGTVDYGGVLIQIDSRPEKMVVFGDPSGALHLPSYSLPIDAQQLGTLHLSALSGDFMVGSVPISTTFVASSPKGVNPNARGFSDGAFNYLLWTNGPQLLAYQLYNSDWTTASTSGSPTIDTLGSYNLEGVWYDPSAAAGREVVLALGDYSSSRVLAVFTPLAEYKNGTFATVTPTVLGYPSLQFQNAQGNNLSYTRKGLVVVDNNGNAALMDFNGKKTGHSLYLGQGDDLQIAFDLEGDDFYVFNTDKRMLYWGKTGW